MNNTEKNVRITVIIFSIIPNLIHNDFVCSMTQNSPQVLFISIQRIFNNIAYTDIRAVYISHKINSILCRCIAYPVMSIENEFIFCISLKSLLIVNQYISAKVVKSLVFITGNRAIIVKGNVKGFHNFNLSLTLLTVGKIFERLAVYNNIS